MNAAQRMLDVTSNNLANVSTNGFKSDGLVFRDALEKNMNSNGRNIGQISYGVSPAAQFTHFDEGPISQTGNVLDVAITGPKGAFKVQTANGARFTRDGSFRLDSDKQLVDRNGNPVLDSSDKPITIDGKNINIQQDGSVIVDGRSVADLGVFEGTFVKEGQNLFTSEDSQPAEIVDVQSKATESSNVNAVESMVQMITVSRAFDLAQKAVQQHDELSQILIQSLSS